MSFHSSRELEADCSEPIFLDGALSDMSNGTTTASASSPHASETDSCLPPQSSLTCVSLHSPVQPTNTEELRTWLQQAFPASRSVARETNSEPTTSETCGRQQRMSFTGLDRASLCWKTSQGSLLPDTSESCSVTWPQWGSMRNGECWERTSLMPTTCATEFGYWPTPQASDSMRARMKVESFQKVEADSRGGRSYLARVLAHEFGLPQSAEFTEWLMIWPEGWTDLKPLETDKYQEWLQQHSIYSHEDKEAA